MLRQIPLPQSKVRRQPGKGKRTEKSPPLPEQAPILCGGYARLSAITPAKTQTRHARGIQTDKAKKYMNVGGTFPTPEGFPERACMTPNTRNSKCGCLLLPIAEIARNDVNVRSGA